MTLRYADGRPIVSQDAARNRAVALATVSMLPGANMRFAIIAINLATDWASLQQAFKLHVSPTNLHYADIDGNTGWQTIGFTPRRPKHDGLFPAPGDGDFDWTGLLPVKDMPHVYNPPEGWFASANQMNLPAGYPYRERIISFNWSDPYRYDRCAEVLRSQPKHRIEDSIALQHDVQSLPARALLKLLPANLSAEAAPAAAMLRRWDCGIEADSAAALLFEMVMVALSADFRDRVVPAAAKDLIPTVNLSEMLRILGAPDKRLGDDPAAARDALIDRALVAGWTQGGRTGRRRSGEMAVGRPAPGDDRASAGVVDPGDCGGLSQDRGRPVGRRWHHPDGARLQFAARFQRVAWRQLFVRRRCRRVGQQPLPAAARPVRRSAVAALSRLLSQVAGGGHAAAVVQQGGGGPTRGGADWCWRLPRIDGVAGGSATFQSRTLSRSHRAKSRCPSNQRRSDGVSTSLDTNGSS